MKSVQEFVEASYSKDMDLDQIISEAKETIVKDVGGVDQAQFISLVYGMVAEHEKNKNSPDDVTSLSQPHTIL